MNERGVGSAKLVYEGVGVANVAVVDSAPSPCDYVVTFSWVARVCAYSFHSWAGFVTP